MSGYLWKPIEPLSDRELAIDTTELQPLYDSWHAVKARLHAESPETLAGFRNRLVRSLSIETGILERLYDLDRGTTEALVLSGFVEDLVSRSSTDIEPSLLIDILRDQEAAVLLVMDAVASNRSLSPGFIHELHAILTKHQHSTRAIDQFGSHVEIPLLHGQYKEHPNNPTRAKGQVHEYCPPVQVRSEMENLLQWLASSPSVDPLVQSAWLHHRFTQIHPYQDGNGRVARALTTLVLLKADLLPLVIDRDLRSLYVEALEQADVGDLQPLFALLASLEKKAILQALSVDIEEDVARDRSIAAAVIDSLAAKFNRRLREKEAELRHVNDVAASLRGRTKELVGIHLHSLARAVAPAVEPDVFLLDGGPDVRNSYWYKKEVVDSARESGKWVNFAEGHYFLKATMRYGQVRLVFVTSFHHIGRELSGIMEATAFAFLEFYEEENDRVVTSERFFTCSLEPFVLTWNSDAQRLAVPYDKWLDAALAIALKEWGDHV